MKIIDQIKNNDIIKSSAGLLLITVGIKLFGYFEKLVLAYYYGTSYKVDAFTVVLTLILASFFFFREIVEPGFLNSFLKAKNDGDEKSAWGLFNNSFRVILVTTILISIITILFPRGVIRIFAPGFENEEFELSVTLIRIAIPACIFLALSTLTSITLNGLKYFVLPASGELAFKGLIIICMILLYKSYGIIGATIGIVVGSGVRFAIHITKLFSRFTFYKVHSDKKYYKNIWILTWPLLLGVSFSQLSSLIDNIFASYLQEGSIAALSYSKKIVELPVIIFPYVLSIVVFPYFSELAIVKNVKRLYQLLSDSLKWIVMVFIPLSIFFIVYSADIIEIILQRGAFDIDSTILTAKPFTLYSIGLTFMAIETILVIFYYANADTKTPIFVGILCVIINIIFTYVLIRYIGYKGIALAFVIQKILKNIILLVLVKNKVHFNYKEVFMFLFKILICVSVFFVIILAFKYYYHAIDAGLLFKFAVLLISFLIGAIIYSVMLYLLKILKLQETDS